MTKKRGFVVLVLVLLAIAVAFVGYRMHQKAVRETQKKSALAAQAKAVADARYQKAIQRESAELVIASQLRTDAISIKNLKLEDEIAEMEGRPAKNRIAIARLESKQATDYEYKLMQDEMIKQIELEEKAIADPKPFPDLFAAEQASIEDYIDALIAQRQANAGDDDDAIKAADIALKAALQRAQTAAVKYKEAVEAAARYPGK